MDISTLVLHYHFEIFSRARSKFLIGNFTAVLSGSFFLIANPNFQNNLVHTDISKEIDDIDAKMKVL